jgi:hypothetical protein
MLVSPLDQRMKYLGFFLKPNDYRVNDWHWLLQKVEKKIGHWTSRWLSLGGRLVLVNSVLQNMLVYWLCLAKVALNIIDNISQIFSRFLWKGAKKPIGFHLAIWDSITRPKDLGGWGIQNLNGFEKALDAKSLCGGLFGLYPWSKVLIKKYLKGVEVVFWLRTDNNKFPVASKFWKNFMGSLHLVNRWLAWSVGNGTRVHIGQDPFICCYHMYKLPDALVRHLNDLHVYSLAHITYTSSLNSSNTQDWLSAVDLGLEGELAIEWSIYLEMLINSGVTIKSDADLLV